MLRHLLATTALAIALGGVAQAQQADDTTEPLVEETAPAAGVDPATDSAAEGDATTAGEAPAVDEGMAAEEAPVIESDGMTAEDPALTEGDGMTAEDPAVIEDDLTAEPVDPLADPAAPVVGADPAAPQLAPVDIAEVTVEELVDASLRNPAGETLGSIDDAVLDEAGKIQGLVVSFGGFLGFGEKTVEVGLDEIELMKDEAGNVVAETPMTPETLESRPDYVEPPDA